MTSVRKVAARNPKLRAAAYRTLQARARMSQRGRPPRVLVNSIPKAGTHLLTAALEHFPDLRPAWFHVAARSVAVADRDHQPVLLDSDRDIDRKRLAAALERPRNGQFATGHLFPYPCLIELLDQLGYRAVLMVRDPRDVVVSMTAYRVRLARHGQNRRYTEDLTTLEDRLVATIEGVEANEFGRASPSIGARLGAYEPWLACEQAVVCRFEDLVGPRGGGSATAQIEAIRRVGEHIDRPLTEEAAAEVARRAWSPKSATFRAGRIGEWRESFTDRVREAFSREVGDDLLARFGYEPG